MKNPDFICIGAPKTGTTWLYENLKNHPDVELPYIKELHFFDEIERNVRTNLFARFFGKHWMNKWWRDTLKYTVYESYKERNFKKFKWIMFYFFFPRNFFFYKALFSNKKGKITGEATPDYCMISKPLILKIRKTFPNTKIILLLRNPIEREWSQFKMVQKRKYNFTELEQISYSEMLSSVKSNNKLSNYVEILDNWNEVIPENDFFIGFYDEIKYKPENFALKICQFLNIDSTKFELSDKVINKGNQFAMPIEIENILKEKYFADITTLAKYFENEKDNFPKKWLESIKTKVNNASEKIE